ncbi:MAG: hypothetical protein D4R88_00810 [Methanosarcinales archaeon]|nr:MAG: hypothetical protein D4R88_00810 [Methanosarcinales archaeon]
MPKDFKESLLLRRLEEGDEQLIQRITDAELSRQGKDILGQNIPEWIFDLSDSDLKEFMESLQ